MIQMKDNFHDYIPSCNTIWTFHISAIANTQTNKSDALLTSECSSHVTTQDVAGRLAKTASTLSVWHRSTVVSLGRIVTHITTDHLALPELIRASKPSMLRMNRISRVRQS